MAENVVEFDLKVKDQKRGVKKEARFNPCRHKQMLADVHLQQLECADCGKVISAWDYILKMCKQEQNLFDHIKYAKQEKLTLEQDLSDLKRKVKNAKAQLKRANKDT